MENINCKLLHSQNNSIVPGTIIYYILFQVADVHTSYSFRYQTEGSRGAVKDRSGNGFPIVKLLGYDKPTKLQIFIGTDVGRVAPHMFYQACKVSGKNSTPCNETKVEGTILIEIELKPESDMTATCDCVGILKVRQTLKTKKFQFTNFHRLFRNEMLTLNIGSQIKQQDHEVRKNRHVVVWYSVHK